MFKHINITGEIMPNSAHLHLILNHFPIIGTGMVILVLGYAVYANDDRIKKLGMFLFVFIGLITLPVFFTGGKAAGIVKGNEGIVEENIEPHEEYARTSMISMEFVAAISLVGLILYRKQKPVPVYFGVILLILILIINLMMVYTGHLGGKISHSGVM
jgi:uncharacterized membrane protein